MGADLHDSPGIEHDEPIGPPQRGQPVGDRDRRPPGDEPVDRRLNDRFGLGIDARRGLVEDQDPRVYQQRPGDREPLPLAAGEATAAFADAGVVGQRLRKDEVVRAGGPGRGHDVVSACRRPAVGDVVGDRAEEQKGLLEHAAKVAVVVGDVDVPQVYAVDPDRTGRGIVKPADQVGERRFARAARAHQPDHLPRLDGQVDTVKHFAGAVAEVDPRNLDPPLDAAELHRPRGLRNRRLAVEDLEDPLGARRRPLRGGHHANHRFDTAVEPGDVGEKRGQGADRHARGEHEPGAAGPDHQQADLADQAHDRARERPDDVDTVVGVEHAVVGRDEPVDLAGFLGEGLDDADARDGVGQHAGHVTPGHAGPGEAAAEPLPHGVDQPDHEREGDERENRQQRVEPDEDGRREGQEHHVRCELDQVHRQEGVDLVGVAAHSRHQVTSSLALIEVERQRLHVGIGSGTKTGGDPLAHPAERPGLCPGEEPGRHGRGEQAAEIPPHERERHLFAVLLRDQHVVDQRHGQVWGYQRGCRAGEREDAAENGHAGMRPSERDQPHQRPP